MPYSLYDHLGNSMDGKCFNMTQISHFPQISYSMVMLLLAWKSHERERERERERELPSQTVSEVGEAAVQSRLMLESRIYQI